MIESIARFFSSGGPFMWVLLLILATALAVIIERLVFFLHGCSDNAAGLVAKTARALNEDDIDTALAVVTERKAPLNMILGAAVSAYRDGRSLREIRRDVEERAILEVPRLSQRLNYLAMFANIATLAGLLGTIFGLQKSFSSLAMAEAAQKAALLASGISQAMNTTALGLIVAIPCLIAYAKLSNMQAARTEELDAASVRLLNYFEEKLQSEPWSTQPPELGRVSGRDEQEAPLSVS